MAADPDDRKAEGTDGDKRGSAERRTPPLTIDLAAASSSGRSGNAQNPSRPAIKPRTLAGPAGAPDSWFGIAAAAVAGAVIAVLLLVLLQVAGILPSPGAAAARDAAATAKAAQDAFAALGLRVSAIETAAQSLPALQDEVTAGGGRISTLEQGASATAAKSDLAALNAGLSALQAKVAQLPPSASPADVTALAARVAKLEAAAAPPPPATTGDATASPSGNDPQLAALSARLDADEAAIAKLSSPGTPAPSIAGTDRTAAVAALKVAVNSGGPFGPQLDAVAATGPSSLADGLRPYAVTGIASRDTLAADFPKVADTMLAAADTGDSSLLGRLVSSGRSLVTVRPVGPVAGSDPAAIVSRMTADVGSGDLAGALKERDGLPQAGKDASARWAAAVEARLAADTLLAAPGPASPSAGNG